MQTRSSTLELLENYKRNNEILWKDICYLGKQIDVIRKEKKDLENKSILIKILKDMERETNCLDQVVMSLGGELQRLQKEIEKCNICKNHITQI